jgi:hypothetical protein
VSFDFPFNFPLWTQPGIFSGTQNPFGGNIAAYSVPRRCRSQATTLHDAYSRHVVIPDTGTIENTHSESNPLVCITPRLSDKSHFARLRFHPEAEPLRPLPRITSVYAETPPKRLHLEGIRHFHADSLKFRLLTRSRHIYCIPCSSLHTRTERTKGILGRIDRSDCTPFKTGFTGMERQRLRFTSFLLGFEAFAPKDNPFPTLRSKVLYHAKPRIVARIGSNSVLRGIYAVASLQGFVRFDE